MTPESLKNALRAQAHALGFQLFGVADAQRPLHDDLERLDQSLDRGDAAGMSRWLGRHTEQRVDPTLLLPGARSVVMVGMSHAQAPPDLSTLTGHREGRLARYALARDYHQVLGERLENLARWLDDCAPRPAPRRPLSIFQVDSGPLAERAFARQAGLGFIGRNNALIHPRHGSWFSLGALLTRVDLAPFDPPLDSPRCPEDCRRCLDACPTAALAEPHRLDARRCLSYLNTETRDSFPPFAENLAEGRLFGCDACQETCPFNASPLACAEPGLLAPRDPSPAGERIDGSNATLENLLSVASNREFNRLFAHGPLRRARLRGMRRNALAVARALGRTDLQIDELDK